MGSKDNIARQGLGSRWSSRLLLVALSMAACSKRQFKITVSGDELFRNVDTLRSHGKAQVLARRSVSDSNKKKPVVETIHLDQSIRLLDPERGPISLQIVDLIYACDTYAPALSERNSTKTCALTELGDQSFLVRTFSERYALTPKEYAQLGIIVGSIGLLGASVTCLELCEDDSNLKTASTYLLIGLGVAIVALLVECVANKTCHD